MGIFSTPNPFDPIIGKFYEKNRKKNIQTYHLTFLQFFPLEKVTDAKNTAEDWGHIMDLCDQVQQHKNGSKECLKAIVKRLNHQDPHVVLQAVTVSGLHCIISYHESFTYIVEVSCFNILEYLIPLFKRNEQNSATIVNLQWENGDSCSFTAEKFLYLFR